VNSSSLDENIRKMPNDFIIIINAGLRMEKADIKELSVSLLPNMMDVVFFPAPKSICLFLGA